MDPDIHEFFHLFDGLSISRLLLLDFYVRFSFCKYEFILPYKIRLLRYFPFNYLFYLLVSACTAVVLYLRSLLLLLQVIFCFGSQYCIICVTHNFEFVYSHFIAFLYGFYIIKRSSIKLNENIELRLSPCLIHDETSKRRLALSTTFLYFSPFASIWILHPLLIIYPKNLVVPHWYKFISSVKYSFL